MRTLIILAVLMGSSVNMAFAQNKVDVNAAFKEAKAVLKESKGATKEGRKAAKKALKEAQKEMKKAEKEAKKAEKAAAAATLVAPAQTQASPSFVVPAANLTSKDDSIAYIFGLSQAEGLKSFMKQQLGIDSIYTDSFSQGINDRLNVDPNDKAKQAYNQGMNIGSQIEQMAANLSKEYYAADPDKKIDPKTIAAGIFAGLYGKDSMSSQDAMKEFNSRLEAQKSANQERLYGKNKEEGAAFLAENKTKEGVVELPSGLQYKVITMGTGEKPKPTSKVKVNYVGRLIDGTEFDSSYKRKEPTSFKCNQVIKGWTEALCLMTEGSTWELYIPYNLAYGERAAGKIPPYSTLIFTVELLEVEDATAAKPAATTAKPAATTVKPAATTVKPAAAKPAAATAKPATTVKAK